MRFTEAAERVLRETVTQRHKTLAVEGMLASQNGKPLLVVGNGEKYIEEGFRTKYPTEKNKNARHELRHQIHNQWTDIYNLFHEVQNRHKPSFYQALNRFERLIKLRIHPYIGTIMEESAKTLYTHTGDANSGYILLGSGSRGGAQIRTMSESTTLGFKPTTQPDVDAGLIFPSIAAHPDQLRISANNILNDNLEKNGLTPCIVYRVNDQNEPIEVQYPTAAEDVYRWLKEMSSWKKLQFIFLPTYPPEIGRNLRRVVLEQLMRLSLDDHKRWKQLVEELKEAESDHTVLKEKYFTDNNSFHLNHRVARTIRKANLKIFCDLLDSTDQSTFITRLLGLNSRKTS